MRFSSKVNKELKEWGIFATIVAVLYFTGLHTEVAGFVQRLVLYTGVLQPNVRESGDKLADYNLQLVELSNNKSISLEKSREKVVFMNYWATWCPPCIAEMPNIQSLYDDMNRKNVDFYLISVDKDIDKAIKFIKRKGYTFPVYFAKSAIPEVYSIGSIPSTFVINKKGEIVVEHKGMADYDTEQFKSLLLRLTN